MDENRLTGLISQAELEEAIQSGLIDTVMIAFCDMQGPLMGKRLTGEFCLRGGLSKGTHFCMYLLGTD